MRARRSPGWRPGWPHSPSLSYRRCPVHHPCASDDKPRSSIQGRSGDAARSAPASGSLLARLAIHCRFVDRFAELSIPSRVSRQWLFTRGGSLPSAGSRRARFPVIIGTMKPLRLPVVHVLRLMSSPSGTRTLLEIFVLAFALPAHQAATGLERCSAGAPTFRRSAYGHERDLSGSLATHPAAMPCSETPAEPVFLALTAFRCPRTQQGEGFSTHMISRLIAGLRCPLSTLHERRCRRPCKTRFRLAGCAFAGRASNPLGRDERFQVTCHSPFQGLA